MIIKTVTGAGYGDEGKGLMTDYFCGKLIDELDGGRVLNIKVNGGAQAGHTVCRLDKESRQYKHWVFRQYGSGTFTGADTYLLGTFMVNFSELLKEREKLREIYNINTKMFIDKRCRVTLPMDILMNRCVEEHRTHRHGSCGLGIYETFHRNNDFKSITVKNIIREFISKDTLSFEQYLYELTKSYIDYRVMEFYATDSIQIKDDVINEMLQNAKEMNKQFIDSLVDIVKCSDIKFVDSIDILIRDEKYEAVVFECSQGLELDQYNERNFPHLTPSNTGLMNITQAILNNECFKNSEVENCFVTRSYKTKHGAGFFIEEDTGIQSQFNLYDRTNHTNSFQGTLKYGHLKFGRMKKLIFNQLDYLYKYTKGANCKYSTSLAITHLDQTNECLVLDSGIIHYSDMDYKQFDKTYLSFGEKASDII